MLGASITMSDAVGAITLQQLAAYASGFSQDNGDCLQHPSTGYPAGMTASLASLFGFLKTYNTLPYAPGSTHAYSCQAYDVDLPGTTPTTSLYNHSNTQALPVGYDKSYAQAIGDACPVGEYGSGGIVSTPGDMLAFLLYGMSSSYHRRTTASSRSRTAPMRPRWAARRLP